MHIEVDQSGKIGDTKVPTVLALSNGAIYAILIPATVKRACLQHLRRRGYFGTTLYIQLFSVALYLLLKDRWNAITQVTVDDEYPGHGVKIKEQLVNLLRRAGNPVDADKIRFDLVHRGIKKPPVHDKAFYTYRGELRPDRVIGLAELLGEFQ